MRVEHTLTYGLAPQGVFATVQGEGVMLGVPMVFVRLAGCPVGCDGCDTDYLLASRASADDIARRAVEASEPGVEWAWVTGGEPAVYDLSPLFAALHRAGFRVAVATSGIKAVPLGRAHGGCDFLSVSPHRVDDSWAVRRGDQLNVVPGLNGLKLSDLDGVDVSGFAHRFVTPCWYGAGDRMDGVREAADWVGRRPGWRVGIQAHKVWGLP